MVIYREENKLEPHYAIEVINVKKSFKDSTQKLSTLKEKILNLKHKKIDRRIVLDDISFNVKKGEVIGLIGENGAGKSTTLKLLSRIIYPNEGKIILNGRVACLIELGAGFHPELTGRENIYTNASIFGLNKKEIEKKIDEIISFSELEKYIDNPVRTYSSGMYMRLAFSIAVNVDADILLIDEILAVGDAAFQAKCFNKLLEIKAKGTTIVIVSHSMSQIELICDRAIWFKNCKIESIGKTEDVTSQYNNYMDNKIRKKEDNAQININKIANDNSFPICWTYYDDNCRGFAKCEGDGTQKYRWIVSKEAEIYLGVPAQINKIAVLRIIYINALSFKKTNSLLNCNVFIDNVFLDSFICNEGENVVVFDVKKYLKNIKNNSVTISLKLNYLWCPFEIFENNNDFRKIGISISEVRFIL